MSKVVRSVYVNDDIAEIIVDLAKRDNRPVSQYLRRIVTLHLEALPKHQRERALEMLKSESWH